MKRLGSYDEVIPAALAAVPEIRADLDAEKARWAGELFGPYNLFDIVLMPRVHRLLREGEHEDELRRIFDFFEDLMGQDDPRVRDLVGVSVCEDLCSHEDSLQKACRFMGPRTKRSCDEYTSGGTR